MTKEEIKKEDIMLIQMQEIIRYIDKKLVNMIPEKIKRFIFEYKSINDYEFNYDKTKTLIEQEISQDTKNLIAYFDYYYWANDADKKQIEIAWEKNEKLKEEYNPENFLKNKMQEITTEQQTTKNTVVMTKYKERFLTRVVNKIKKIFHIN